VSAPSAKQRGHVQAAFVEGVTALLRRALTERFGFRLTVDGKGGDGLAELLDDDGVVMMSHRLAGVQLALPLGAPTTAPSTPPTAPSTPPAAPPAPAVTAHEPPAPLDVTHALTPDGAVHQGDDTERLAPIAVPPIAVPPIAPAGRVLRAGDAVHAPDGSTWIVRAIEGDAVHVSLDGATDGLPDEATVARDAITLDAADLWRVAAVPVIPEAPTPGVSQVSDGHPAGVSETPEAPTPQAAEKQWTLFSIEVPDTHDHAQAWAHVKGLAWCCGGYLNWGIEGGASRRGRHRMVAIVPRSYAVELLDLCNDARLTPDMLDVDHGDSLLRVGSRVRRESGVPWLVASIDRTTQRATLECDGATIAPDVAEIEPTTDGSGDFVLVPLAPTPSKTPARVVPKVGCAVSFEGRDCTLSRLDDDGFTLRLPDGTARRLERELLTWDAASTRFVAVDAYKGIAKSSKRPAPKANPPKIPEGCVELRVSARDFPKHRKGLLALSMKPLDGVWKRVGDVMAAVVNVEGMSARRVLSYCNGADVKLAIEGRPSDVAKINGGAAAEAAPEPPANALPRATRATLRVDQLVRVASGSAGINGVPVSLAGESVVVVKLGPKLAKVYCRKLGRSYSVPFDALELLDGGAS